MSKQDSTLTTNRDWTLADRLWDQCLAEQQPEPQTPHHSKAATDCLDMWLPKIEAAIDAVVPNGRVVIDIGCGTGWLREYFGKRDWLYYGVSLQDRADSQEDFHFRTQPTQCPLVFCRHVVEHSPMPILALTKLYEFTAPGGWCIMITPDPRWYARWPQHFSVMPRASWVGLIERTGFAIEQIVDAEVGDNSIEQRFLLRKPQEEAVTT